MKPRYQICHFTTVHKRNDIRIRLKQVRSLTTGMNEAVALLVQDGKRSEIPADDGIHVIDTGRPVSSRVLRMIVGNLRMWRRLSNIHPVVAHFHDAELIPTGIVLKMSGIKMIYDVHEDLPRQIMTKHWLPSSIKRPTSWAVRAAEWAAAKFMDAIVPVTPGIEARFPAHKCTLVQNYPIAFELVSKASVSYMDRPPHFAFVGALTPIRAAKEMVQALEKISEDGVRLRIMGSLRPAGLQKKLKMLPGWANVDFLGWVDRGKVADVLSNVRAGLVLFHPGYNNDDSQPNKLFEYMAAGLPVIASNFKNWRRIVEGESCGILVDPKDSQSIADAMRWVLDHPYEAAEMGRRGQKAVSILYNWDHESSKLINLYKRLVSN